MKRRGRDKTTGLSLSSPTGGSSVQVYHDCQKVAFKMHPGNGSHTRDHLTTPDVVPDVIPQNLGQRFNMRDEPLHKSATLMMDSSSQVCSGPEDNSTDPHESLTGSSTITFVDTYTTEESVENNSLHGAGVIYPKEIVLIDDDENGDMSLREKTVTDLSVLEGKAADLVCGRLLSTSSGSLSEWKDDRSAREDPPPQEVQMKRCCGCILL